MGLIALSVVVVAAQSSCGLFSGIVGRVWIGQRMRRHVDVLVLPKPFVLRDVEVKVVASVTVGRTDGIKSS